METLNSIGFVNFWGVTPAYNIFQGEDHSKFSKQKEDNSSQESVNILINNTSDFRHIIKTIVNYLEFLDKTNQNKPETITDEFINLIAPKFNFYFYEFNSVNIARLLLFLHLINDQRFSIRDRVEFIIEIYGNTLLSARTALYLDKVYTDLIRYVTGDSRYKGCLSSLVDLSLLTYKEKDELAEIFSNYSSKVPFDIEKYRDDRLRFHYKDRYDHRDNLADWDYNMNLRNFAGIIRSRHYLDFRRTGISFELRFAKYNMANRTLCSYIPGREVNSY